MILFSRALFLSFMSCFYISSMYADLIMVPKHIAAYFSHLDNTRSQQKTIVASPMEEEIVIEKIEALEKLLKHSHDLMIFHNNERNNLKTESKECLFGVQVKLIKAHLTRFKKQSHLIDKMRKPVDKDIFIENNSTVIKTVILPIESSCSIDLNN